MPKKRSRASHFFDRAVDSLESATAAAGNKMKEGLDRAADAVADSDAAQRIADKATAARKSVTKKAGGATKVAKKQATVATKKAGGAKKVAKKQATVATKKAGGAKKAD